MRGLVYYGPKDIRLEELPMPEATGTDVVVKVARAGICGSDLTAYLYDGMGVGILQKGQFGHDGQFGHEMVGTVYQVGSEVEGVSVGDRVFINPTKAKRNGMMGCDIAGAFSEYTVVEDAKYGYNLFKLADDITFDEAVVIEPLSVGTHGKNIINVRPSDNVVIYGAGTIGLCALSAVVAMGCKAPVVVDLNEKRLEYVEKLGGVGCCPDRDGDVVEFLTNHFGPVFTQFGQPRVNVDAFIDCAGGGPILSNIIGMAKMHARIAVVAVYKRPAEIDAAGLLSAEITLKGSCGFEHEDLIEAFNNVNGHRTNAPIIVSHEFSHDQAVEAFEFAADPTSGGVKVVINYDK